MPIAQDKIINWLIIGLFIAFGIALRFLPHPPNFTPIAALALFASVYLKNKWSLAIPLTAMLISDWFIGFYAWPVMISVYFSFILAGFLGWWLRKKFSWPRLSASAFLASIIFFILTNFSVWAFTPWYSKNLSGLIQCFYLALPFFRNTLAANLFFSFCFFGAYQLAIYWLWRNNENWGISKT